METIYEQHMRQLADHTKDESCWCNPTWEMFPECDGTMTGPYLTHHLNAMVPDGVR